MNIYKVVLRREPGSHGNGDDDYSSNDYRNVYVAASDLAKCKSLVLEDQNKIDAQIEKWKKGNGLIPSGRSYGESIYEVSFVCCVTIK